jgi:hypothetical protein
MNSYLAAREERISHKGSWDDLPAELRATILLFTFEYLGAINLTPLENYLAIFELAQELGFY